MSIHDSSNDAQKLTGHLKESAGAARSLTGALGNVKGHLSEAVGSAAKLAVNIAKVATSVKGLTAASGIGLVVQLLKTGADFLMGMKEQSKEVAKQMREIASDTAVLNAKEGGNQRVVAEKEIAGTMERELASAHEMENFMRKFPELQDAIRHKAEAARRALAADIKRDFDIEQFETRTGTGLIYAGMKGERKRRIAEAEADFARDQERLDRNVEGYSNVQILSRKQDLKDRLAAQLKEVDFETVGIPIGLTIAAAISEGIVTGIQTGSVTEGLKALTGAILIGFGNMLEQIGTQAILASQLIVTLTSALANLDGATGIAAGLALITLGSVLKGVGSSMGGRARTGRVGAGGYGGYSGGGGTTYVGVINPPYASGASTSGLVPMQPVIVNQTIIGPGDPTAQRQIAELARNARARGFSFGT